MIPDAAVTLDLGQAVVALAAATFLASLATSIGLGLQRGRVKKLETRNTDLETELSDEVRRRKTLAEDLATASATVKAQGTELVELRTKVTTMTEVVHGVTGPIANLVAVVERTNALIDSHNQAAMDRLGELRKLQNDALRLIGHQRQGESGNETT